MDYRERKKWQKLPQLKMLLDLSTPPKHLYFSGRWNPKIFDSCVAIVGSRRMTSYGERVLEKIVPQLIQQGKTVVSGFMYGIDQYAHRVCVEGGGLTIAVLGWGINTKLTGEDWKLAQKIIATGGLIISEWEDQKAAHWTFPVRNRIVAALSEEVIIVEAAEKSGSLITARLANKLKRTLWAVPGPITSRTSVGTNNMIAEGVAKMWLGKTAQMPKQSGDDPILEILLNEALTASELARKLNMPVAQIGAKLSILLLSGQVGEIDGKYHLADAN